MAFFFGFYLKDKRLSDALDLIRFLAEPNFFRRAHITVRGPYPQKITTAIEKISKKYDKPFMIHINDIGAFLDKNQNTVFLKCGVSGIEKIWRKPDFDESITPHLTLYDGKSREFSRRLMQELRKYVWNIIAEATELTLIESKKSPTDFLDVFFSHDISMDVFGRSVDYQQLRREGAQDRLIYISWVCKFIQDNYSTM